MKSAKHTKYEGNPRHAKGLQIFSEREYKRLAKRAASMALAAAMAASTLCAPALAVKEYDAANGTVYTGEQEGNIWSWQGNEIFENVVDGLFKFNHTSNKDFEININPGTSDITNDQVLHVNSGTTGLDITVDGVTATVDGENVIKVEEGTKVGVTIKDSDLTSTGGEAAISIDGESVMDIEDSTIKGGGVSEKDGKKHAAIEVKGNSKVALDNSTVTGNGTGVYVEPNATLIIGGAEVKAGELILTPVPEEPGDTEENVSGSTGGEDIGWASGETTGEETHNPEEIKQSLIIGNMVNVAEGGEINVSGTGILAEGQVEIRHDGAAQVFGTDVTVSDVQRTDCEKIQIQQESAGIVLTESAEMTVDGILQVGGTHITMEESNEADVVSKGQTGLELQEGSSATVSENGILHADDALNETVQSKYFKYTVSSGTSPYGKYAYSEEYGYVGLKNARYDKNGNATGKKDEQVSYRSIDEFDGKYIYFPIGETTLYTRKETTATLETKGNDISIGGNAQLSTDGLTITSNLEAEESSQISIGEKGLVYAKQIQVGDASGEEVLNLLETKGDGVHLALYRDSEESEAGIVTLYYDIAEGNDAEKVVVDLNSAISDVIYAKKTAEDEWDEIWKRLYSILPAQHYNFDFKLNNKSGHTYVYEDQSFQVSVTAQPEEDIKWLSARCPNEALQALYGKTDTKLTFEDLLNAEKKAIEAKYESLDAYYLYYLNQKFGTEYVSLGEANPVQLAQILNSNANAQYTISWEEYEEWKDNLPEECNGELYLVSDNGDGTVVVQLKEGGETVVKQFVDFYNVILGWGYGERADSTDVLSVDPYWGPLLNLDWKTYQSVGDYQDPETYTDANAAYAAWISGEDPLESGLSDPMMLYFLTGSIFNNPFQVYPFSWTNTITLARIDPDPVPPTDPEDPTPDPDPTPDEPTLILTPVPEEETPLAPAPVEEIPEEETPLVDAPVIDESLEEVIEELGEEEVPLASAPKTGDESGVFGLMAVLSGMALGVMSFFGKKKEQ